MDFKVKKVCPSGVTLPGKCAECSEETDKMCQNCGSALCESCFNEIHSKYQSFKNHVYKKIELKLEANMCEVHADKPISCYCNNCSKCRCIDCLILTTNGENCKSHEVVPLSQMHGKFIEELKAVSPKVDETLKHLSNTAAQISDTLKSYEQSSNMCEISQMILNVQNHFTKLLETVRKHEYETIAVLEKLKIERMQSLLKAKEDVFAHINETERIIDSISAMLAGENADEIKLSSILESAKLIENIPWCLQKSDNTIKVRVQEEVHEQIHRYIRVESESHGAYSLVSANGDVPPVTIENMPTVSGNSQGKPLNEENDIQEGTQRLVYISHVNDPHDFYVQLSSDQDLIKELIETYRNSESLPVPSHTEVKEGSIMLGYHKEHKWYRCQIMSNENFRGLIFYSIFYIDFGITDHVTINQLRPLESSQSRNPPPLAYHCKLANLQPVNDNTTDSNLPEEIHARERKQSGGNVLPQQEIEAVAQTSGELSAKDKEPIRLAIDLVECQSPSLIYIKLKDQHKEMMELYHSLNMTYCSRQKIPSKFDWKVGDRCCARCKDSGTWRRAKIIQMEDKVAKLFFVDFAVIENVPVSKLRVLLPKFLSCSDAAIKCHLRGIKPASGEDWPSDTVQHLSDQVSEYRRFCITKTRDVKEDKSLPIELWGCHITMDEPFEPQKIEYRSLNTDIIENGLAIPLETAESDEGEDGQISLKSSSDWDDTPKKEEQGVIHTSGWLPVKPFSSLNFSGAALYVNPSGVMNVAEHKQADSTALIANIILDAKYDVKYEIKKGALCLARYSVDQMLYRGKVLDIKPDHCIVRFVDFGNVGRCSLQDITVLPGTSALHKIPVQVHKCALAHVIPTDRTWTTGSVNYIRKILKMNFHDFKVVGEPIGQYIPVQIKVEEYWLHDHLVELGYAVESAEWPDFIKSMKDDVVDETDSTDNINPTLP